MLIVRRLTKENVLALRIYMEGQYADSGTCSNTPPEVWPKLLQDGVIEGPQLVQKVCGSLKDRRILWGHLFQKWWPRSFIGSVWILDIFPIHLEVAIDPPISSGDHVDQHPNLSRTRSQTLVVSRWKSNTQIEKRHHRYHQAERSHTPSSSHNKESLIFKGSHNQNNTCFHALVIYKAPRQFATTASITVRRSPNHTVKPQQAVFSKTAKKSSSQLKFIHYGVGTECQYLFDRSSALVPGLWCCNIML